MRFPESVTKTTPSFLRKVGRPTRASWAAVWELANRTTSTGTLHFSPRRAESFDSSTTMTLRFEACQILILRQDRSKDASVLEPPCGDACFSLVDWHSCSIVDLYRDPADQFEQRPTHHLE